MNRRGFLTAIAGVLAGTAVDPERLLWTPGRKLISVPKTLVSTVDFDLAFVRYNAMRDAQMGSIRAAFHRNAFVMRYPMPERYRG